MYELVDIESEKLNQIVHVFRRDYSAAWTALCHYKHRVVQVVIIRLEYSPAKQR